MRSAGHNLGVNLDEFFLIIRFTRHWIHYGLLAHFGICVLVAGIEGMAGK